MSAALARCLAIACLAAIWLAPLGPSARGAEAPPAAEPPAAVQLPLPPLPPLAPPGPPPADPHPALYRAPGTMADGHLLALAAEPVTPLLKSGKPTTIKVRPHDIVQAPGDPKPIEGTITDEPDGRISFRDIKGIAHPKNPLTIADLLVFQRQAATVPLVVRERSQKAGASAPAHLALAQDCLDGGFLAEAEAELKRALELDPSLLAAHLKLADLCVAQTRRDDEVAVYQAALAAGADAPELRERLALRCLELGLFRLAGQHLAQARKAAEPAAASRLLRLEAEARLFGGDATGPLLRQLAEAASADPAAANLLALVNLLDDRTEPALAALSKVAEAPDPPASALNNLGALLFNAGEREKALAQFEACRRAAPRHTKAIANAALACAALGRLDEAQGLLAAIATPPDRSVGYHLAAGYVHECAGKPDAALAAYQQARALDPGCLYAVSGVARCHLARGDAQAAAEAFAQARLVAPADPAVPRGLGICHYRAGRFAAAVDTFRPLAAREGADPLDLVRLAIALLHQPDGLKDATQWLDRALAAAQPPDPYALAASAYAAHAGGDATRAEDRFRQARRATAAPDAAKYAAAALERLAAQRGEEVTLVPFGAGRLPEGWRATGEGSPAPELRQDEVRFDALAPAANERAVTCTVPLTRPAEKGPALRLARFDVAAHVPLTNDAAVGVLVGAGSTTLQLALRTTRQPQLSRRLAYRIIRDGQAPTAWADLPGTIALERLRLGLGPSTRAPEALDVYLNGKPHGDPLPLDALKDPPPQLTIGFFVAPEPQQQCLFVVRDLELVWKKQ
ncbi:MAG: tetratricopeptide repeat protein [Planctomycetes bacterium]|nr:tetratricopeptide repeat protein [Planctomycetota bacterium]